MLMPDGVVHIPDYEAHHTVIAEAVTHLPWDAVPHAVELIIHPATTSQEALFHTHPERRVPGVPCLYSSASGQAP